MEKLDYLYSDIRHDMLLRYKSAVQHSIDNNYILNIINYNDYVTDEVIGEGGFKHPIDAFYNVLTICVSMVNFKLMDEYFFKDINNYIKKYHNGEYDKYLFNKEKDKKEIDKDINIVLNYYKKYKDTKK